MRHVLPALLLVALAASGQAQEQKLKVKYKGLDAAAWYERLADVDPITSLGGAEALKKIGKEAVPYLLKALKEITAGPGKWYALNHFPPEHLADYRKDLVVFCRECLKHEAYLIRGIAAGAIGELYHLTECRADLEAALKVETHEGTRELLAHGLERLDKKKG